MARPRCTRAPIRSGPICSSGGPAADALAALVEEHKPDLVLFGMTYNSRDVAGRLAAKLGVPVIANGLDVSDGDGVAVHSSVFGATLNVTTRFEGAGPGDRDHPAQVLRRRARRRRPGDGIAGDRADRREAPGGAGDRSGRRCGCWAQSWKRRRSSSAAAAGLGDPKNFELLDQLAAVLGNAAVGASRAVVDAGWVPYAMQVGQTGKTVKPAVYLAFGISGAMQHTVGMKGAKAIVAVNRDENAPIFKLADLGVVGDALKVLPALVEELQRRRS